MSEFDQIRERPLGIAMFQDGEQVVVYGDDYFRSHAILVKVRELLDKQTPHSVILEIIDHLESGPSGHFVKFDVDTMQGNFLAPE